MLLHAAHVLGLRSAAAWEAEDLGPVVDLPAPPDGVAVADGLSLLHAALDAERARTILDQLGLLAPGAELHLDEHGFLDQVVGLDPGAVAAMLHEEHERKAFAAVGLFLDPVLYGRLREESLRDPRVVTALGQDPALGIKVGWLFTRDLTAGSVTVLDLRIGELSFPVHGSERPSWTTALLAEVGRRFGRPDPAEPVERLAERLVDAMLSPRPELRAAWRAVSGALGGEPFGFGDLEVVRTHAGTTLAFGAALRRVRQLGPVAARDLRVVAAALLDAPDVLVVDEPVRPAVRDWLVARTSGSDATLEQVVFVGGPA